MSCTNTPAHKIRHSLACALTLISSVPLWAHLSFGVGEHTDYGLLTLLHQDKVGGLQIKTGMRCAHDWFGGRVVFFH